MTSFPHMATVFAKEIIFMTQKILNFYQDYNLKVQKNHKTT